MDEVAENMGIERSLIMLLMSTMSWIIIGVAVVVLIVVIAKKIKDTYY
jgi:heme/copper-type cytochrome/quinol oxidase subunit 2